MVNSKSPAHHLIIASKSKSSSRATMHFETESQIIKAEVTVSAHISLPIVESVALLSKIKAIIEETVCRLSNESEQDR